jgi:hypothetical protein
MIVLVRIVGSEVRTAVTMQSTVFWDVTSCSLVSQDVGRKHSSPLGRSRVMVAKHGRLQRNF